MFKPRSDRKARLRKKRTRKIFRWTTSVFGFSVLLLCLYTFSTPKDYTDDHSTQTGETTEQPDHTGNSGHTREDIPEPVGNTGVSFAFVGDIMMGGNVDKLLKKHGYDYPYLHTASYLKGADIAACNLENPVTAEGKAVAGKQYVFRTSPDAVPAMLESGLDVFNLANNHTLDYGLEGLRDTIRLLDEAGLYGVGAGMNEEEAYRPAIIERNGVRVAFIGLTHIIPDTSWKADKNNPGLAETYDYTRPVKAIEKARKQADIVVVLVHWGREKTTRLEKHQTEMARRYVDAGADLVIGSHPHVLQGIERYKGKWIAYSLGNFIFTQSGSPGTNDSAILEANCGNGGDCRLKVVPVKTAFAQPKPMEEKEARLLLAHLDNISVNVNVQQDGYVVTINDDAVQ